MHPCPDPSLRLDKHTPQTPVLILILCYPSMLSQQQVRDESPSMRARSTPRTTEATRCYPIHFASPSTTSEETTVLWISSISDGATAETTQAQCRCDDHTQDTAHEAKWSLHGQLLDSLPAQMEGYEGPGKVVSTDSKTSRSLGRVAWKVPGRGPTERPTKISRLTQRSLYTHTHTHTHTTDPKELYTHTHTHTLVSSWSLSGFPLTAEHMILKCSGCLCLVFLKGSASSLYIRKTFMERTNLYQLLEQRSQHPTWVYGL